MEKKMETTNLRVWGYIRNTGIMEKKMEATISGLGLYKEYRNNGKDNGSYYFGFRVI